MPPRDNAKIVAIVEDEVLYGTFLCMVCEKTLGYSVVGAVETGAEGIALCRQFHPDLLLLDIGLPDGSAFDILPAIEAASPDSIILVVSAKIDEYTMIRILDCGVRGFVDKEGSSAERLTAAILTVVNGGTYFAPIVTEVRRAVFSDPRSWHKVLTPREQQALSLIGEGLSNDEAGGRLGLSPNAVKSLRQRVMAKLGLRKERELMRFALQKGLAKL
jgi:DNA-binding NarL/FixJ family response regulator